ncbi:protein-export chaperone SecB [Hamadaea sp. NPDC050747]|uniref:protein-export chaperone SecB n=1 Tax=Hamadaea sp. NPDC050747 TaxID=3155789 RepID=UPI0034037B01
MDGVAHLDSLKKDAARMSGFTDVLDVRLFGVESKFYAFPGQTEPLTWNLDITPTVDYESDDDTFVLNVEFRVQIVSSDDPGEHEDDEHEKASLQFTYAALFSVAMPEGQAAPTEAEVEAFGRLYGVQLVYPYAREFVQSITSRMGFPPLTISQLRTRQLLPSEDDSAADEVPTKPAKRSSAKRR